MRRIIRLAASLCLLAVPFVAKAQPTEIPRVCVVGVSAAQMAVTRPQLIDGLRIVGLAEGRDLTIDVLTVDGDFSRFPEVAAECVRRRPHIIVPVGTPASLAAKQATATIPIVSVSGDPVATGIVASLARPGGNVTGVGDNGAEIGMKCLELMKEILPDVTRVTLLANLADPIAAPQVKAMEDASRALGVRARLRDVRTADALPGAFGAAVAAGDEAVVTTRQFLFQEHRVRLAGLAVHHRLPTISAWPQFPSAGGLLSYHPTPGSLMVAAARQIDRILKGARPGDLPVEHPTTFELVVNAKAARAFGIAVPPSVLLRADRILE